MSLADETTQPRNREEPVSFLDLRASEMHEFITRADRQHAERPEDWHQLGVCRHCGANLASKPEEKVIPIGVFGFLPNVCCQGCCDAAKARWATEDRAAREARFFNIIPTRFVNWDDSKGNVTAKNRAFKHFSLVSKKGLVLHGSSGSCKTFIAWQIVRMIVEANDTKSGDDRRYTWLFCDSFELSTKGIPAEAHTVDFLVIDDLGNEPTSTKFETALLHMIRKRTDWERAIIVTTQLTGKQFKERFFNGAAAEAIMRRFHQCTIPIDTDNRSVAGMGSAPTTGAGAPPASDLEDAA